MPEFRIFESREAASAALAHYISEALTVAIAERGTASCVVSGGASPVRMYRTLRQHDLSWEKVVLVPSDERLVAVDHDDSNEGMIRGELIQEAATAARFLSLAEAGISDRTQLSHVNSQLAELARPLDIVLLGMGEDGHTASLFPDSPDITDAIRSNDFCVIQQPEGCAVARLTLTPALLLDARKIVLLFFGQRKRDVYDRAVAGGNPEELPVRFLLQQSVTPVVTFWAC